jgi:hypothetical protein
LSSREDGFEAGDSIWKVIFGGMVGNCFQLWLWTIDISADCRFVQGVAYLAKSFADQSASFLYAGLSLAI